MITGNIAWAGIVLVMDDGSKRAIEFNHPHNAQLTMTGDRYGLSEVTVEISGHGTRWHYGEEATPSAPARAIATGIPEIERG